MHTIELKKGILMLESADWTHIWKFKLFRASTDYKGKIKVNSISILKCSILRKEMTPCDDYMLVSTDFILELYPF